MDELEHLSLYHCHFDDLPPHLYGERDHENVIDLVRRDDDARATQGSDDDAECKLLVVGNGGAGKTSLVRLLRGDPHRDDEPSTHAIWVDMQPFDIPLRGTVAPVPVRVNIWDFGGQDLYHETHRLFFQTGAVHLLVWNPWEAEAARRPGGVVRRPAAPATVLGRSDLQH